MEELIPKERPSQTFDDHGRLLIDGSLLEGVIVKSLVGVQSAVGVLKVFCSSFLRLRNLTS